MQFFEKTHGKSNVSRNTYLGGINGCCEAVMSVGSLSMLYAGPTIEAPRRGTRACTALLGLIFIVAVFTRQRPSAATPNTAELITEKLSAR